MGQLLLRYPGACFALAFVAAMIVIRFLIAPAIVQEFGHVGFIVTLGAIFLAGFLLDRRT